MNLVKKSSSIILVALLMISGIGLMLLNAGTSVNKITSVDYNAVPYLESK